MTDSMDVVARFLAKQPVELRRAEATARWPRAEPMVARGEQWKAFCAELGIPCPPALVLLGDAQYEQHIYFTLDRRSYGMLDPADARIERAQLAELAAQYDIVAPYVPMLPLFGEDGDLLLLDRDGAIHSLPHDDWPDAARVAESLDAMLELTMAAPLNR